jgi:hypothetical protein
MQIKGRVEEKSECMPFYSYAHLFHIKFSYFGINSSLVLIVNNLSFSLFISHNTSSWVIMETEVQKHNIFSIPNAKQTATVTQLNILTQKRGGCGSEILFYRLFELSSIPSILYCVGHRCHFEDEPMLQKDK